MKSDENRQLCEVFHRTLERLDWRAHVVYQLLGAGNYRQACQCALPLVGTPYNGLFLYVRAWQRFFEGYPTEAAGLLREAYGMYLRPEDSSWKPNDMAFDDTGLPQLSPIFRKPPSQDSDLTLAGLEYLESLASLRKLSPKTNVGTLAARIRNRPEAYSRALTKITPFLRDLIHYDSHELKGAVDFLEFRRKKEHEVLFFLRLCVLPVDEPRYRTMKEALWRVASDWGHPVELCQTLCFAAWFSGQISQALSFSELGLRKKPENLVCGLIRGLALYRHGKRHLANEQWRKVLEDHPRDTSTYLVLGRLAEAEGREEVALRYYYEAQACRSNPRECNRLIRALMLETED